MIVETVRTLKAEASLEFDKSSSQFDIILKVYHPGGDRKLNDVETIAFAFQIASKDSTGLATIDAVFEPFKDRRQTPFILEWGRFSEPFDLMYVISNLFKY